MRRRFMQICKMMLLFFLFTLRPVSAETLQADDYQRDYIKKVYDSEQGLEGSAANCIYATKSGVILIGSYTGLFSYDSHEFVPYEIEDYPISINAVTQDANERLWIGTNGNGLYHYDGETFQACPIESDANLAYTVNKLCIDEEENLWAATKSGMFYVDTSKEELRAVPIGPVEDEEIKDFAILSDGRKVMVTRSGRVFLAEDETFLELSIPNLEGEVKIRCVGETYGEDIYLGTDDTQIIRLNADGSYAGSIEGGGLSSYNKIYEFEEGSFWVCSDSGVGLLQNGKLEKMDFPIYNSIEDMCVDYQGNYWFASSRQGVLHIYENYFSDLSDYLEIHQTVNSIEPYGEYLYIGTDEGLYCYQDKELITEDALVQMCAGQRIRQVYADQKGNLWIVTYRLGLFRQSPDGTITEINSENSELTTNAVRCIYEKNDGSFLVGTEGGLFVIDTEDKVGRLVNDESFNLERILAIAEDAEGYIFIGTDGDGLYMIKDGSIQDVITADGGLFSNVILKIKPSPNMQGIWVVTGAGICFVAEDGTVSQSKGATIANSLDIVFLNQNEVAVLAGNGFFRMREDTLLTGEGDYLKYDKKIGLPVDFTANAWNMIRDNVLYLCGTDGAASLDLQKEIPVRTVRTYVNDVEADGKSFYRNEKVTRIDADTHRLNLDIRILNFTHETYKVRYILRGTDSDATIVDDSDSTNISYTNLDGGDYEYLFEVLDDYTDEVMASRTLLIRKRLTIWEETYTQALIALLTVCLFAYILYLVMRRRDKEIGETYRLRFQREKKEELAKIAYQDIVTGASNRNLYEIQKKKLDLNRIYALVMVSVNHAEYIRNKQGVLFFEQILNKTVELMRNSTELPIQVYRISEYIFCFWVEEPINLEEYTQKLKTSFAELWEEESDVSDLAVGAVYNDKLLNEDYATLFKRCDDMRRMDQKHGEMKFMDRKIQYIQREL